MDFSTFAKEKLGLTADSFNHSDEKVTYHASCHLCRGLGVKEAPRELIAAAADYVPAAEEEVCCGFGGTYSAKFPEVSAALLRKKLDGIAETGAARVVMDCPGCVLQIRGGAEKDGKGLKVTHIAELLAENVKKYGECLRRAGRCPAPAGGNDSPRPPRSDKKRFRIRLAPDTEPLFIASRPP